MSAKVKKKSRTTFGATAPPFIDYLKDILRRYPDGGQILKELIQNADDAKATKVVFIHDERSYGTESLWTDGLGEYQGPALYAYNNAAFSDDDWEGIQRAGRSVKRDDPNKVGRFGIGFNSIYHITDVPSILSSEYLGCMDPQEKIFGEGKGGFRWSLDDEEHQETLMTMHDQFQPLRDIVSLVSEQEWSKVITEDHHFEGTIFRFPLRNKKSEISDNLYDSKKVVELFESFIADAELSLLFLKNVTSVSLVHISEQGAVNTRLEVKSSVPADVFLESEDMSVVKSLTRFKVITLNSEELKESKWLLTSCTMKDGNVEILDSLAEKLKFFPQVDLAFPCGEKRDTSESRLSCYLPLPNNESNKTGLPVYINAYFGLTDNRRHIKWQEEDQKNDEHAVWNELLMKEVLPDAYVTIIQDAIRLAQESILPSSSVYDLWPDIAQIRHREKWYAVTLDVLHHLFRQNMAILSLAKDERKFITPSEAVFPCNGPTGSETLRAIKKTLVTSGEDLVTVPRSVAAAINEAYPNLSSLKYVTPSFLRNVLSRCGVGIIAQDDKLCILEYILSDGQYSELEGLQLLPLSDGSFRSFTYRDEDTALIDSVTFPRALLPCCENLFIPDDLSPACSTHLKELARQNLFKVINIDANKVAEYTHSHFPPDWKQGGAGLVTWEPSSSQHPPLDWLQEFWRFLNTHFTELSHFSELPLIPVSPLSHGQPVSLARLKQNTTLIFQQSKQTNLPDQIVQLVNKVGGTVLRGNEWLKHEDLDSYVLSPSPRSVMKVLVNLDSRELIRELKTASHDAKEELKDYLSRLDYLSSSEQALLSQLPLFQTMKGYCAEARSKKAVLLISGLKVPTEFPLPDSIVKCATEADHKLLQLLKINLLDTAQAANLLIDIIESGTCRKDQTQNIMAWILKHGDVLFFQNQALRRRCADLNFIEVNGAMRKTSTFFDPRIQTFKDIFESDFFPPPFYTQTVQMLKSLTDLGLINKAEDMSPDHLIHAAKLIEKQQADSQTLKRAQVLLKILDTSDLLSKFSCDQLKCFKMLKWVPGTKPDKRQCDDSSQTRCFFCPDEMRHSMYEEIIGLVMPIVGEFSDSVSTKLGLKCLPPAEKVMENLSVLASKAEKMDHPDTNVIFKKTLHSIYNHMQDHISDFTKITKKDTQWLWCHNQFVSPQDLVLDYPPNLDLSSYIEKVPNEFLPYKKLLQQFGTRTLLTDDEIVCILQSIKKTTEERQPPFASPSELKVTIEILNWLWREKKVVDDIPVPVMTEGEQYTLKPSSSAVFCDISKSGLKDFHEEDVHIIHEEIPKATAEWLNIQFLSTYILAPELVGIEQCGQSEPITTRIKNILKEYDEDSDIFKELIQNAEDAGADACKFLVDFRVHKDTPESLIDPDMALCQGPCLWAFNDQQFSAEDWENIVRVGAASKENKVEKIGKFGLGFNTVYHITDIPSIFSGNRLLILDPNVTHLKKHIKHKTNPGLKLDLSQQHLFRCFPGQFRPYEGIFGCTFTKKSLHEPYPGTLFKLPFRTEEEALVSEISSKVYFKDNVSTIQEEFTRNSQTHLLFLKNISILSLQNIANNVSTPPKDDEIQTIFTLSKATLRTMKIPDDTSESEQLQAEKSLKELDVKCKKIIDSCKVHIVEITSEQLGGTEVQSWLLYNCFGTHQSLQMALQGNKQAEFSLPIGGVAVPLKNDAKTGKMVPQQTNLVGQAFCFLPLSIQTGLPVNVNGTFAVTSNRKGLWESGVKNEWNRALLQDPTVTAYVTALQVLKNLSKNQQLEKYQYHTFWPDREKVSETFKPLVDAFYRSLAQPSNGPELFSDGESWCSMNSAVFLHENIEEVKDISALAMQVCKNNSKVPVNVIPLPLWLRNSFKQAGLEQVLQNRTWTWEKFYQEAVFNNLGSMDPKSRDILVLHAIDLNIKEIDNLLLCHPCIPTKGSQLQYITRLVDPSGKVACLFEPEEGRLLGGTSTDFRAPKRVQRLLELGMAKDHLPLKDIAEKAGDITKTWSSDKKKAYGHVKCLLELMKNQICDEKSPHWEALKRTEFLPAFSPGGTTKERKKGKIVTLRRPTEVFSDNCSLLVNMRQPVLDHTNLKIHYNDPVLKVLGVHDSPSPEEVFQQLHEAYKQSESTDGSMLKEIADECYKFLDHWLCVSGDFSLISQKANLFPFILIGSTFVNVNRVAQNEQFEAKPYLYVLPTAYSFYRRLWECVGVEQHFTLAQFETVLQDLHSKHGNKPLPKSDLSICLTVLNNGIYAAQEKMTQDFLVPNEHRVLQPVSKLFYNDSPWIPEVASGVTLCHKDISRAMANHFGIKTTRHHTLKNCTVENISPFAFHFEQHEQLTVRIKNIIAAYPAKKDILKELIQNADDAEATEIHFVWDKRQHSNAKTFGERWNDLQGPALCVFNNKVFSDADLKGIQQLGEGGKHSTPGKTGKYGVGFNSVYHLTDCPSILTGDKLLCISDPNQKFIESYSDKPPAGTGYRLDDTFKSMYNDVYKSFLPEKFPLKEGTMFRLPLRMGMMANSSEISQQGITEQDMRELCSILSEDPEGLILFLKNICKIQVHEICEHSEELKTIYTVEKSLSESSKKEKDAFVELRSKALQTDQPASPHKAIYGTLISTSDEKKSKWIIAEQFGSFQNSGGKAVTETLPQAAVAARINNKVGKTPASNATFVGVAFCSLPLPGNTGLPVHVNANFEVDSARRSLWKEDGQSQKSIWNESLKQNVIAPLYADLLHYISRTFAGKKASLANMESFFSPYLRFWPSVWKDVSQEWHEMIHKVYKSISERGLNMIPVLKSSMRKIAEQEIREYSFDWCDVKETEPTKALYMTHTVHDEMHLILEDLGMALVPYSMGMQRVWKGFRAAGIKVKDVNPSTVQTFLRQKPLSDPAKTAENLPLHITSTLIRDEKRCSKLLNFCLKELSNVTKSDPGLLNGLPLLLTRDKVLRVFNTGSPKLISRYDHLFSGNEDKFADYETNEKHMDVLKSLNFVKNLTIPCAAEYLEPVMKQHLQKCETDPDTGLRVPNEAMLNWLKHLWKFLTSENKPETSRENDQSKSQLSEVRKHFSDCCILPVVCPRLDNKHLLQTMKEMPSVIPFSSDKDLSGILFRLGFLRLNSIFFSDILQLYRSLLYSELMDVNDHSAVLDQVYKVKHPEFSHLTTDDRKELQTFLQSGVSKSKDKLEYQRKLKSLPLFETTSGDRVRIDGHKEVFILNSKFSGFFPDLFVLHNNESICLRYSPENITLSQILNIIILEDLEYFMKFVLPVVHRLTERQMIQCLKLLLSPSLNFSYFQSKEKVISSLKTVKMICSSQDRLETASYYFDDSVELYRQMLPKERFVPEKFWTELCDTDTSAHMRAKDLLKELGMKYVVSEDDIIKFAYQIESEAKGNSPLEQLKQKSSLLLRKVCSVVSDTRKKDTDLLGAIADIKFIFPVKIQQELCNYHHPFATERQAVKIKGSLIESDSKHQDLIWTSMPIIHLPSTGKNLLEKMKKAGAHDQPPSQYVTSNMSNICQSPCTTEPLIKTRAKVFRSSYAHLQGEEFKGQALAGLPVVLVEKDTELVRADQTAFSFQEASEFRPYLFRIPPPDVKFEVFFKAIGVKDQPTARQYCNVLEAVSADSHDKPELQANQQKTVKRAVQQLFDLIASEKKLSLFDDVKTLYLPAVDGKLHPSSSLYYNDTVFEAQRLEDALTDEFLLLENLGECYLGDDMYTHHRLLLLLPQKFQLKMLSKCTEERIVESHMQPCSFLPNCSFSGWFEEKLSSRVFTHGLICLIRHHSGGKITEEDAADICKEAFGSIQIVCCKNLETELCVDQRPLPQTATKTDVLVKKEQQGCIFYLTHYNDTCLNVLNDISTTLSKEIIVILGKKIDQTDFHIVGQLLLCDTLKDVQKKLAKNGIRDSAKTKCFLFDPPLPGTVIPEHWHDCLDQNILNNFEEGEYVGYSTDNGKKYIYAIIVEAPPGHSGQYLQQYKVDIGQDEPIKVSSLDLFQFKRQTKPEPKRTSCSSIATSCMELEQLEGADSFHQNSPDASSRSSLPATIEEAKREIDNCLAEIWTLPEEERHKATKRLYLRWHPDKNPGCQILATEAFKYLQNRLDDLSKGIPNRKTGSPSHPRSNSNFSYSDFSNFYQEWNQEARRHRESRERFSKKNRSYNFWTHHENVPRPDREEARRWCRQACCDLAAAHKDVGSGSTEWCLFKVHQAVEKSLIAAEYKRNGQHPTSSSILDLAEKVSSYNLQLRVLPQIVDCLIMLGVDAKKTQYPNCHHFPHIPNDQFKSENEMLAINRASELLSKVETYVN